MANLNYRFRADVFTSAFGIPHRAYKSSRKFHPEGWGQASLGTAFSGQLHKAASPGATPALFYTDPFSAVKIRQSGIVISVYNLARPVVLLHGTDSPGATVEWCRLDPYPADNDIWQCVTIHKSNGSGIQNSMIVPGRVPPGGIIRVTGVGSFNGFIMVAYSEPNTVWDRENVTNPPRGLYYIAASELSERDFEGGSGGSVYKMPNVQVLDDFTGTNFTHYKGPLVRVGNIIYYLKPGTGGGAAGNPIICSLNLQTGNVDEIDQIPNVLFTCADGSPPGTFNFAPTGPIGYFYGSPADTAEYFIVFCGSTMCRYNISTGEIDNIQIPPNEDRTYGSPQNPVSPFEIYPIQYLGPLINTAAQEPETLVGYTLVNPFAGPSAPYSSAKVIVHYVPIPDTPGSITLTTSLAGNQYGDNKSIAFKLIDPEYDISDITVGFSVNGGSSYSPCTLNSSGTENMITSPNPGTSHTLFWDMDADIGSTTQYNNNCRFKIQYISPEASSASFAEQSLTYAPPVTIDSINLDFGPLRGGNTVTIQGTGFGGTVTVNFGGVAATNVVVSSIPGFIQKLLTCTVPAGVAAGLVSVQVVSTTNGSVTEPNFYEYVPLTVTDVSPAEGPALGGNSVTITGTDFYDTITVKFDGVFATSVVVNPNFLSLTCVVPSHPSGAEFVDVQVLSNTNGNDTLIAAYEYIVPSVDSVDPDRGLKALQTEIEISGEHFDGTVTVTIGGVAATDVVASGGGTIVTCKVPTSATVGPRDVVVTSSVWGAGTLVNGYTYTAPTFIDIMNNFTSVVRGDVDLQVKLTDEDSDDVDVALGISYLLVSDPNAGFTAINLKAGVSTEGLGSSPAGETNLLTWDTAKDFQGNGKCRIKARVLSPEDSEGTYVIKTLTLAPPETVRNEFKKKIVRAIQVEEVDPNGKKAAKVVKNKQLYSVFAVRGTGLGTRNTLNKPYVVSAVLRGQIKGLLNFSTSGAVTMKIIPATNPAAGLINLLNVRFTAAGTYDLLLMTEEKNLATGKNEQFIVAELLNAVIVVD